ncbi:MAG: cytochrome c biogenesis protein CcdA, partial [Elusimicrobia bacterium]|nr:cytochrome c biogenesis protein CcdA [Elusimicrobiota bacterium]
MDRVSFGMAFLAGVVSFLSPCILPLVPGYISMVSGLSLKEISEDSGGAAALKGAGASSVCFVLGFSAVFIAMGASASLIGGWLSAHLPLLTKIGGLIIVFFGLHTAGILPIRWLYYEKRLSVRGLRPGLIGAFFMGAAFAFGWTPCIGPILAAILALAATQQSVAQGTWLLAVYSMGLGLPFIATAFAVNAFLKFFARYKTFIRWGEIAAG